MIDADFLTWVLIGVVLVFFGVMFINHILNKRNQKNIDSENVKKQAKASSNTNTVNSSKQGAVSGGSSVNRFGNSGSNSHSNFSQSQSSSSSSGGGLDPLTTVLLMDVLTQDNQVPNHMVVSSFESSKPEPVVSHTPAPVATSDDSWSGLTSRASNNDRSWSGIETSSDRSSWSNISAPAVETTSSTPSYSAPESSGGGSSCGSSGGSSCGSSCGGGGGD